MESKMEEGLRDRGLDRTSSDQDIEDGHHRMMIGLRLPKRPRRPKSSKSKKRTGDKVALTSSEVTDPSTQSPSETVQQILGEVDDETHTPHRIFCQMDVLFTFASEHQWREYARWVKYEEDVEEGGERWSKPHVASLSLHSLFELRSTLLNGAILLDVDAYHITQVADLILDQLINGKMLEEDLRDEVRSVILCPHVHAHQKRRRSLMPGQEDTGGGRRMSLKNFSFSKKDSIANASSTRLTPNPNSAPNFENLMVNGGLHESASSAKLNKDFMRKIPENSEACNVIVGELNSLKYQICAFVRLSEGRTIGELSEVPIPTRFLFLLLGPPMSESKNVEIGRSVSTIMVDEVFREVAYKARNRQDLLAGIDEFLDQVTVLPPGEWDPKIRIEPPDKVPSQENRKYNKPPVAPGPHTQACIVEEKADHCDPTLQRTGRLFGGLIADVKRKIPWYASDFKDCLHIQCVASTIFLFLATLTPNVTFGGLLGQATNDYMGAMECILAASIVGILFALFSGQPLNILGSTGPMLVLEMILYSFCKEMDWDYMPLRCWTGLWTALLILLVVAFDLSALVRYITRFTEECFACLIAVIFIYEAFKKLIGITKIRPVNFHPEIELTYECACFPPNYTAPDANSTDIMNYTTTTASSMVVNLATELTNATYITFTNITNETEAVNWTALSKDECKKANGTLLGPGCDTIEYVGDVFFFSVLLFLGTFTIANALVSFKTSRFFPTFVRQSFSDFAVLLSILLMVVADVLVGLDTPKLNVPEKFEPTKPGRPWFISPFSPYNPWWTTILAVVPAFLATLLIFMDQQITAVIVNRKENKLVKGNGYHLDMLVVAVCVVICSILGLPWYVAATVSALAHIMSLKKESETAAPGERPVFLGCREQRVTALLVGILSGLAVFLTGVLKYIPMPVLYGVFFYMGVAALKGMQFIDRLFILFMPAKYQPDYMYLRHVRIKRVHLFTFVQVISLGLLWVVKMVKSISIVFPLMVVGTCFIRKGMDWIFTQHELKWLDDIMPEASSRAKEDAKREAEEAAERESLLHDNADEKEKLEFKYGKGERYPNLVPKTDRVNISEEVNRSAIWLQVRRDSVPVIRENDETVGTKITNRKRPKDVRNGGVDGGEEKAAFFFGGDIPEEAGESRI